MKAETCHLYTEDLSLRVIARKFRVSKEAVRKWIMKFEEVFAKKKHRGRRTESQLKGIQFSCYRKKTGSAEKLCCRV
ncbi:MAG: helix-turn-helix domain-containing protein [Nitrososphaerales archaeon]